MTGFLVNPHDKSIQIVGTIDTTAIQALLGINFPVDEVHMYPGVVKTFRKTL